MKKCTSCSAVKEISEFPKSGAKCRVCKNKATKEWREKNKEKYRAGVRAWKQANPDKLKAQKQRHEDKVVARNTVPRYLYEITMTGGYYYRGQSVRADRLVRHTQTLEKGNHCNHRMQELYDGGAVIESFVKVEGYNTEKEFIGELHITDPMCLNMVGGNK